MEKLMLNMSMPNILKDLLRIIKGFMALILFLMVVIIMEPLKTICRLATVSYIGLMASNILVNGSMGCNLELEFKLKRMENN